jgi:hypothetical protein
MDPFLASQFNADPDRDPRRCLKMACCRSISTISVLYRALYSGFLVEAIGTVLTRVEPGAVDLACHMREPVLHLFSLCILLLQPLDQAPVLHWCASWQSKTKFPA